MTPAVPQPPQGSTTLLDEASFRAAAYFPALDGLRALAILAVLLHHVPPVHQAWLQTLQRNGRYGVGFFFLISGFLIATLLLREKRESGRIQLGGFYLRRTLRLFPLYYLVLALEGLLVFGLHAYSADNRHLFAEKLPSYLLYFSNWRADQTQGPFFFAWSLAAEEQFYLTFAVALVLLPARWIIAAAVAAWMAKVALLGVHPLAWTGSAIARVLLSYQEPILIGVLLAYAMERPSLLRGLVRWLLRNPALPLASAALLLALLATHELTNKSAPESQLAYLLMTVCMAGCILRPRVPLVSHRWTRHVGKVSYGIYLLHMYAIMAAKRVAPGSPLLCLLAGAALATLAATLVHRHFESRFIALGRRLSAGQLRR